MPTRSFVIVAAALCFGTSVQAESRVVSWGELAPPAVEYVNPFEGIAADQMDGLRKLLRLRMKIDAGQTDLDGEAASLKAKLEEGGLDVDWLLEKRLEIMKIREAAATNVNQGLIGKRVRIPGYLLPLQLKGRKAVEFLLVAAVGACIHTPPPPANQLVHVRYPHGIEITGLYAPIWIEGPLAAQSSVQNVGYVDGKSEVNVSYAMDAESVIPSTLAIVRPHKADATRQERRRGAP